MATRAAEFAKTGAKWGAVMGAASGIFYGVITGIIASLFAGPLGFIGGLLVCTALGAAIGAVALGLLGGAFGLFFKREDQVPVMEQNIVNARARQQEVQQGIALQQEPEVPQQNSSRFQDMVNSQRQQTARTPG